MTHEAHDHVVNDQPTLSHVLHVVLHCLSTLNNINAMLAPVDEEDRPIMALWGGTLLAMQSEVECALSHQINIGAVLAGPAFMKNLREAVAKTDLADIVEIHSNLDEEDSSSQEIH